MLTKSTLKILFPIALLILAMGCSSGSDDSGGRISGDDTGDDDDLYQGDDDTGDDADDDDDDDDDTGDDTDDDTDSDDTTDDDDLDDTAVDDTGDDDVADVFYIDFNGYTPGPLGAPWTVVANGSSTAEIASAPSKAGDGQALKITGGATTADSLTASTTFAGTSANILIEVEVWSDAASPTGFTIYRSDNSIAAAFRSDLVNHVFGYNGSDYTSNCAIALADSWTKIGFEINWSEAKYNITYNGIHSLCNQLDLGGDAGLGLNKIAVQEWGTQDWGGIAWFDNIRGTLTP